MTDTVERTTPSVSVAQIGPSPLAVEMRRGYGKWLALILGLAGTIAAATKLSDHTQDWPSAVVLLSNLGLVMGPLAIGIAAFSGARAKRRNTFWIEDTTPHGRLRAAAVESVAVTLWALLAYLVVMAVCFVPTWIQATWSGPDVARVTASAGSILALTVIGYFTGRALPYALTAPFLATALFSVTAVVNSASNSGQLALYLPANLNGFDFYNRTRSLASIAELAFYASCGAIVVAGWVLLTHTRRWTAALTAGALGALVASSIGLSAFHGQSNGYGVAIEFSCQGRDPVICTHPATQKAAGQLRVRFVDVINLLRGTPFAVTRAEQRPRGVGSTPTAGAVGFGLDNRTSGPIDEARIELAHNAISQRARCTDRAGSSLPGVAPDASTLVAAMGDRIAFGRNDARSTFSPDPHVNAAITYITSRSDDQFKQLLDQHEQEIVRCVITPNGLR